MTISSDLRQAVRRGSALLEKQEKSVLPFLKSQMAEGGGFKGRSEEPDLYYTSFAVAALEAIEADYPREKVVSFLRKFGDGEGLDLVHTASLVRCWSHLGEGLFEDDLRDRLSKRIKSFQCKEGGFSLHHKGKASLYGSFLAVSSLQDLGQPFSDINRIVRAIKAFKQPGGGYSNDGLFPVPVVPATSAALVLLQEFGFQPEKESVDWLLSQLHPTGGFKAVPGAPTPDLLSTSTSLFALFRLGFFLREIGEKCMSFVLSLYSPEGGFYGSWEEKKVDCEYTFYGLLALGSLT